MALHEREQDIVGLLGRQRRVDAIDEVLDGLARHLRPHTVDLSVIATDARQLLLQLSGDGRVVARVGQDLGRLRRWLG
jgi:hypothetical protein